MRTLTLVLVLFTFYSVSPSAASNNKQIEHIPNLYSGYMTSELYLQLSTEERSFYVMGVIDGLFISPLLSKTDRNYDWLHSCVSNKTNVQLEAMVSKRVRENPSEWDKAFHWIVMDELKMACGAPKN